MSLSPEQKKRALELLERLTEKEAEAVLKHETAFAKWLKSVALDIYNAICNFADAVTDVWNWIKGIFT